jgi:hypothetical protein
MNMTMSGKRESRSKVRSQGSGFRLSHEPSSIGLIQDWYNNGQEIVLIEVVFVRKDSEDHEFHPGEKYIGCPTSGITQRAMREAAPHARGVGKARQL